MTQFPEVSASRQDIRQLIRQRRRALTADQQAHFAQQAAAAIADCLKALQIMGRVNAAQILLAGGRAAV